MASIFLITHPDVLIDPAVPVVEWPLSPRGRARMIAACEQSWSQTIAAIWSSTERKAIDGARLRSIYKSETFPTTGYGHVYNLKPELAARVREAFFTFKWEGTALLKEFEKSTPPQEKFMPISYKDRWSVVRDIDAAMNVSYACK